MQGQRKRGKRQVMTFVGDEHNVCQVGSVVSKVEKHSGCGGRKKIGFLG